MLAGLQDKPPQPPPPGPHRRRRWWRLAGVAVAATVVVVLVGSRLSGAPDLPPRSVHDEAFTRSANAACKRVLPDLRRARPRGREGSANSAALARQVDRTADRLQVLADELRALPVAPDDRPEVERWLGAWDGYVEVGHRYADAVRAEAAKTSASLATEGTELSRRVFLFARANDMPECTF